MHVILGGTGRVGSAVAGALLDRGEPITIVTRDPRRAEPFARRGAAVVVADVRDPATLESALRRGSRAFLLVPPADPAGDTVSEEQRSAAAIALAVAAARPEKVVVLSTYGAQPGEGIGDLGVLHDFEQAIHGAGVRASVVRASVVRAAYFMSNWDPALETARADGAVHTFFPPELALPMVAPADVGAAAARLLTEEVEHAGVRHVEGPRRYSARDVAHAFAAALGREVGAVEIPRRSWTEVFRAIGFSPIAAASYAQMTAITVEGRYERPPEPARGGTTLEAYVAALATRSSPPR